MAETLISQAKSSVSPKMIATPPPPGAQAEFGDLLDAARLANPGPRSARVVRQTAETQIVCHVDLDGVGRAHVDTPIGFFSHMLEAFARHAHLDLHVVVRGDLHIDQHHTVEDTGLVLGETLRRALGDRRGIWRTGWCLFPMDETRAECTLDLSGRPYLRFEADFTRDHIGALASDLIVEFFQAVANSLAANLHLRICCGENDHHKAEAIFKAFARSFELAAAHHPRARAEVPSTKGSLDGTQAPDTQTPDTQTPDTQTPDTQTPDTQTPDTQTSGTTPDTAP